MIERYTREEMGRLWSDEARINRRILPTYNQMLTDQLEGMTVEEFERQAKIWAERGLY